MPPFVWNGSNVIVKLSTVLDFLSVVPELREWYSDTFPYVMNPLSTHTGVRDRPASPVATTRKVMADSPVPVK